jgi:hypothetical protein
MRWTLGRRVVPALIERRYKQGEAVGGKSRSGVPAA